MKEVFHKEGIAFKLVPPHLHRTNTAERAIQSFMSHFISCLSGLDLFFKLSWQSIYYGLYVLILNYQHGHFFNNFNFNSTPLGPVSTKVVAHLKSNKRKSWDSDNEVRWYIGPALNHHCCATCYFQKIHSDRVIDTFTFFSHSIPFPKVTLRNFLQQTATDLVSFI